MELPRTGHLAYLEVHEAIDNVCTEHEAGLDGHGADVRQKYPYTAIIIEELFVRLHADYPYIP